MAFYRFVPSRPTLTLCRLSGVRESNVMERRRMPSRRLAFANERL
jgi:hypothetical protein